MWGSNFISMKYLLRTIDPVELLLLRLMLGSLIFGVVLLASSRTLPRFTRQRMGTTAAHRHAGHHDQHLGGRLRDADDPGRTRQPDRHVKPGLHRAAFATDPG